MQLTHRGPQHGLSLYMCTYTHVYTQLAYKYYIYTGHIQKQYTYIYVKVLVANYVWLSVTSLAGACQAPLSVEFYARILDWVAIPCSRGSSWPRDWNCVSRIARRFFTVWAIISSVQFSRSVVSDSLWPHESQHARPACPSQTPRVYANSCPLSQWCHPAISSSVIPFSSCPQSLPASGSFPMIQLFASGGQITGVSASAPVLPMNTQDWSPSGWTGWISLQSKGLWRVFSNTTVQKHQFFGAQLSSQSNSHIHIFIHNSHKYSFSFKETLFNLLVHLMWVVFSLLICSSVLCILDMNLCWLYLVKYVSPSTSHPFIHFLCLLLQINLSFTANLTISIFLWHMHYTKWSYII